MMQTVAAHSSLECAICFEEYKKVTPRLLSCGHTFCELCLTSLSRKGSLQCPSCRATESLNGGKVFQKNYALEELVQSMFASLTKSKPKSHLDDYDRKQNSKLCDNCSKQAAVLICHDCGGIVYCRGCCLSVHDAMPAVMKRCGSRRTHEPLPFCDELFQCPEHPTAFCIAFCETDRTPICHECIRIGGHASHSHSSLKSSSLRQRTLLDVQLETIRREFNQIKEGREANPKKISEAQAVLMTKTEKIASTFSTLQRLLSAQEEALKAELNAQSLLLTSRLEADNSRIDTAFDTIQQMLAKVAEKMQQSGSSPALDMTFLKSGSFEAQTLLDSVSAQLSTLKSLHAESEGDEKQLPLQSALNSLDDITRSLSDQIKTITLSPTGSFTMRSLAPSAPVSGYIPPAPPVMGAYKKPVVQQQPEEDDEADMGFSLFD